jgi:nitroimidazol reductase NimA-like FMN-containing flavoprotein (pyridoxamine 5'-phosphate oxidase superfamily)
MEVDRNGLEVLPREECLRLVTSAHIGRVAISVDALPAVFPVNYVVDDGRIVFRTAEGTKLDAATANAVVAFEVDSVDPIYHTGWSVLVQGLAREITDPRALERARKLPLRPWANHGRDRFVQVSTDVVSGRRLSQPPAPDGVTGPRVGGES